ncbi:MAG: TonB family protein [Deltaproteobacteria bacterium]|nr:TonB family protein [Deltaproteobacteria bacterium]
MLTRVLCGWIASGGLACGGHHGSDHHASSDAPSRPVSVATSQLATSQPATLKTVTLKTRPIPKGDYSRIDVGMDYPEEARALGIEGTISVRMVVDDKGRVETAVVLTPLGYGLDELAIARARRIEFEPARDSDDTPIRAVIVWRFNMTLPPK